MRFYQYDQLLVIWDCLANFSSNVIPNLVRNLIADAELNSAWQVLSNSPGTIITGRFPDFKLNTFAAPSQA